jgi:inositol hexakisphosphate/diphosphoinositol-pentakisphosphate kinase
MPIKGMPDAPLQLLHKLTALMRTLVDQLREKCLSEGHQGGQGPQAGYSSLSQAPSEWQLVPERPCSGERLLLMFDRCVLWCVAVGCRKGWGVRSC